MPELLDELSIARSGGKLKKRLASYKKVDLLILDKSSGPFASGVL